MNPLNITDLSSPATVTFPRNRRAARRATRIALAIAVAVIGLVGCDDKKCGAAPATSQPGTSSATAIAMLTGDSSATSPSDAGAKPKPKPKPTKKPSKKPCPPKNNGKQDVDKKMFGANGQQITARTLYYGHVRGYNYRIDVENPAPGKRPGSLHVQLGGRGSTRYQYRPGIKKFIAGNGDRLPRRVQDHIDSNPEAQRWVRYGLKLLKEG